MPAPFRGKRPRFEPFRGVRRGGNRCGFLRPSRPENRIPDFHSPKGESATTHRQRADDSFFFAGRDGIGPAERTNAFARHAPSQMARAGMTMLDFAVLRNAETFRGPFVGFQFRHFFTIL